MVDSCCRATQARVSLNIVSERVPLPERLERLRGWLDAGEPDFPAGHRGASVAVLLRLDPETAASEVLLLQRAERAGDRWSGHVSFPGGHVDLGDSGPLAAARREAREELGLDLECEAELLGRLSSLQARAGGLRLEMTIAPFVFAQPPQLYAQTELVFNHEVADAFWFPLAGAAAGQFDGSLRHEIAGRTHELPCFDYEGRTIWGLTYSMLSELIERGRAAGPW